MKATLKTYYVFILLVIINCNAQKLTLNDLHLMSSNKNWETSNKFLLAKGWEYYDSKVGDDEHYNTITWSYEKSYTNDQRANGWIYIYSYDGLPNKVTYRFRAKEYYTTIKNSLATSGYNIDDEEILDQRVIAKYSNPNYFLELTYSRVEADEDYSGSGSYTAYEITVFKKGGIFDPNNGKKEQVDDNGNIIADYILKNGKVEGIVNHYNNNGTIHLTTHMKNSILEGNSTEYFYKIKDNDTTDIVIGKYKGEYINGKKNGKWVLNTVNENGETNLSYTNYKNNLKHGVFTEVYNDSLIVGHYKNDNLDGNYNIYRDIKKMFVGGYINTDTLKLKKITTGTYRDNKKTGIWKTYGISGVLVEEGAYVDDLENGKWKYYYDKLIDDSNKEEPYSGKLYLEVNYRDGLKNGITTRYSFFDTVEEPCADDSTKICAKKVFKKIKETTTYKDDNLDGPYELLNENNEVVYKGNYIEGRENGKWTNRNVSIVDFWEGENTEIGNYIEGLRQQKWDRFDNNGKIVESCTYKDNILHGEQITYIDEIPRIKRIFNEGDFTDMTVLDSLGKPRIEYKLYDKSTASFKCFVKKYNLNQILSNTYKIKFLAGEEIIPTFFNKYFKDLNEEQKTLEGLHELIFDNNIIETGTYENNVKAGLWTYNYYEQKIKINIEYNSNGINISENYYDLNSLQPFSGEFLIKNDETGITEERKIKDGKRNGITRYKDSNDKTIKKETYKEGILKD